MSKIEVTNCQECPFCNNDNEFEHNACNLNKDLKPDIVDYWPEMSETTIHKDCPLRKSYYIVRIKE